MWYRASIFSAMANCHTPKLNQLTFSSLPFQYCAIFPWVPLMWIFCQSHFLWDIILFITATFLIYVDKLILFLLVSGVPRSCPWSAIFSITLFTFNSDFTFGVFTFHFFAVFLSHRPIPSWLSVFIKCHAVLSLRNKKATQQHDLLSALNNVHWPVTNRLRKKWHWSLTIMSHICHYIVICGLNSWQWSEVVLR